MGFNLNTVHQLKIQAELGFEPEAAGCQLTLGSWLISEWKLLTSICTWTGSANDQLSFSDQLGRSKIEVLSISFLRKKTRNKEMKTLCSFSWQQKIQECFCETVRERQCEWEWVSERERLDFQSRHFFKFAKIVVPLFDQTTASIVFTSYCLTKNRVRACVNHVCVCVYVCRCNIGACVWVCVRECVCVRMWMGEWIKGWKQCEGQTHA